MKQPVRVVQIVSYKQRPGERLRLRDGKVVGGDKISSYWLATSTGPRIKLDCGHRHRTKASAERCLDKTMEGYHRVRYQQ
jgi:hypothetical protein